MKKILVLLLLPSLLLMWVSSAFAQTAPKKGPYKVRLEKSHMVPMRDGVKLSTDLYFPVRAEETVPVILMRTPYDKEEWRSEERSDVIRMFASNGYVVAVQDTRGKHESEGVFTTGANEGEDGYDTIDWIIKQSWSNGKVGTFGCSYLGEVQIFLAPLRHPNHLAMIPQAAGGAVGAANNRYRYFATWRDGAFDFANGITWMFYQGSKYYLKPPTGLSESELRKIRDFYEPAPVNLPEVDFKEVYWSLPTIDIMDKIGAPPTDWVSWLTRESNDPWWNQISFLSGDEKIDIPALHVNSWYDPTVEETLFTFNFFQQAALSEKAKNNQFVVISPTTHCGSEFASENTIVGSRDVGDARLDYYGMYLRWFDYWLKGEKNGVTDMPKVQYYTMGLNKWRSADQWPLPDMQPTKYYLHSAGNANSRNGDGVLSLDKPRNEPSDSFTYDPANPVPSIGGPNGHPRGGQEQSVVESRSDVLVYTTPPLKQGIELTGPVRAVLYVSSSAKDTDFTARLIDVNPDGSAVNVQEGILRARYREGLTQKVWMEEKGVYKVEITLDATSNYFAPGHRIRVQVSSSNFPQYDRNLNTGGNNYDETEWVVAKNTIHHSRKYPSHFIFPVIRE